MPCMGGGQDNSVYEYCSPKIGCTLSELEDAFCSACTALEAADIKIPPSANRIWRMHKAKDKARRDKERKNAEREKLRKSALAKLSKDEKDALGLR